MEDQILEGTWEEILNHAPELAGHRLRVTVLEQQPPQEQTSQTLADMLQGRIGQLSFEVPVDLSQRTGDYFAETLTQHSQEQPV